MTVKTNPLVRVHLGWNRVEFQRRNRTRYHYHFSESSLSRLSVAIVNHIRNVPDCEVILEPGYTEVLL